MRWHCPVPGPCRLQDGCWRIGPACPTASAHGRQGRDDGGTIWRTETRAGIPARCRAVTEARYGVYVIAGDDRPKQVRRLVEPVVDEPQGFASLGVEKCDERPPQWRDCAGAACHPLCPVDEDAITICRRRGGGDIRHAAPWFAVVERTGKGHAGLKRRHNILLADSAAGAAQPSFVPNHFVHNSGTVGIE